MSLHCVKPLATLFIMWDLEKNIEYSNYEVRGLNACSFFSVDASKGYTINKQGSLVSLY